MTDLRPSRLPASDVEPRDSARASRAPEPLWRHLLGERLREVRHDRGETLGETAARAGVSPQYLSEMERGRKDASSEMIAAVAGALETELLDLTLAVAERLLATRADGAVASAGSRRSEVALAA